jgi:hypothetical protein
MERVGRAERGNSIRSRNHRLAMLHTFFAYAGRQEPMVLPEAERVAAIPRKRTQPAATYHFECERSNGSSTDCRATGSWPDWPTFDWNGGRLQIGMVAGL